MGTQRKSSSSNLSGADSALQSGPGSAYGTDDDSSFPAALPTPVGPPCSTETHSGTFDRVLSDRGHTERFIVESSDSPLHLAGPPPASFPDCSPTGIFVPAAIR